MSYFKIKFSIIVVVVLDSHIQRIVLAPETTTMTQSRSWSQRGSKVNGSHHGDKLLLKPRGIQIATKPLPGPTNRGKQKFIGVKNMSLGTNYSYYCLPGRVLQVYQNLSYKLHRKIVLCCSHPTYSSNVIKNVFYFSKGYKQWHRSISIRSIKPPYSKSRA